LRNPSRAISTDPEDTRSHLAGEGAGVGGHFDDHRGHGLLGDRRQQVAQRSGDIRPKLQVGSPAQARDALFTVLSEQ
jgi:hypothetical protein